MGDKERTFHGHITRADGLPVSLSLHLPDGVAKSLVVVCHGFKGFKEWGWFPWLTARLADNGYAALRMNFAHSGVEEHGHDFTRLNLFEQLSYGNMLHDLSQVRAAISDGDAIAGLPPVIDWYDGNGVTLLGHSMGGGACILSAALQPEGVQSVIGWNCVGECDRFGEKHRSQARTRGFFEIPNSRTGQVMRLGQGFFDDIVENRVHRDILVQAEKLRSPFLVVQGDCDESVPPIESASIAEAAPLGELVAIAGGSHTFNCGHPFAGASPQLSQALEATLTFLKRD